MCPLHFVPNSGYYGEVSISIFFTFLHQELIHFAKIRLSFHFSRVNGPNSLVISLYLPLHKYLCGPLVDLFQYGYVYLVLGRPELNSSGLILWFYDSALWIFLTNTEWAGKATPLHLSAMFLLMQLRMMLLCNWKKKPNLADMNEVITSQNQDFALPLIELHKILVRTSYRIKLRLWMSGKLLVSAK